MRGLVVTLLCLGCNSDAPGVDAGSDGKQASFEQPIGNACDADESLLCARGAGVCHNAVCCAFCNAAATPRCPDGTMEIHQTSGSGDVCLCATE
jgi:hypothetical protein